MAIHHLFSVITLIVACDAALEVGDVDMLERDDEVCLLSKRASPTPAQHELVKGSGNVSGKGNTSTWKGRICQWEGKYIVTRLWTVDNPSTFSAQRVVNEFKNGFAPIVRQIEGFDLYVGATTNDIARAFFANLFSTATGAAKAQAAAVIFVQTSDLNGEISPHVFTSGRVKFQIADHQMCCSRTPSRYLSGAVLSIRTWMATGSASVEDILAQEKRFGLTTRRKSGVLMSLGAAVESSSSSIFPGRHLAFAWTLTWTWDQAERVNSQAIDCMWKRLNGHVELINSQIAPLDFAFLGNH